MKDNNRFLYKEFNKLWWILGFIWILPAAGIIFVLVINIDFSSLGPFGDFIAGTTVPLLTFISFLAIVITLKLQREQIDNQRRDFQEQLKQQEYLQKVENRVYIDYTQDSLPLLLSQNNFENYKILLHRDIYRIIKHNDQEYLDNLNAEFVQLNYYGKAECVLDVYIGIYILDAIEGEYRDEIYITGFNKEQKIYIPLFLKEDRERKVLTKLEVIYSTLFNERIKFVANVEQKKETYSLITNENEKTFYERQMRAEYYLTPGWKKND